MRLFLASTLAQGRKVFRDTFNRADVSEIGRASDGSAWNTLRGSWSILGNKAKAADANYPLISQKMNTSNNEISIYGTSTGSAAALWITDSGNWWAVGLVQEPTNCNCTYYYNSYYYNYLDTCVGYNAGTFNVSTCNGSFNTSNCNQFSQNCAGNYNVSNCNAFICSSYNGSNCNNFAYNTTNKTTRCSGSYNVSNCATYACGPNANYNGSNCNAITYVCTPNSPYNGSNCNANYNASTQNADVPYNYSCTKNSIAYSGPFESCQTCYPHYVRILQSAANTVSTITQWSLSSLASALKIRTSGSQITVSAYSDSSMVTQIGSDLVYTPTGVTITPTSGLTVIPSTYNQGYTTDEIKISRN